MRHHQARPRLPRPDAFGPGTPGNPDSKETWGPGSRVSGRLNHAFTRTTEALLNEAELKARVEDAESLRAMLSAAAGDPERAEHRDV